MTKKQVPIQDGLFTWPSEKPRLIGRREKQTGRIYFPAIHHYVADADSEDVHLSTRGTLWSWTVQAFLPKTPPYKGPETAATFKPYGVGYIELPGEVIVEARLTESDPAKLRIGMEMEMVIIPFRSDENGNDVVTFAFKPIAG